jgi:hypothetical protein
MQNIEYLEASQPWCQKTYPKSLICSGFQSTEMVRPDLERWKNICRSKERVIDNDLTPYSSVYCGRDWLELHADAFAAASTKQVVAGIRIK